MRCANRPPRPLSAEGVARERQSVSYEVDLRYAGQGMKLTVAVSPEELSRNGLAAVVERFDAEHEQLFTFALDAEHELVGLRAVVQGEERPFIDVANEPGQASVDPAAKLADTQVYADGEWHAAVLYDRATLRPGNRLEGPAIVTEMDSTTLVLPGHEASVDPVGNLLIRPL